MKKNQMPGVKGKSGGVRKNAGRKSKAEEMGLKALLDECFTLDDRKELICNLVTMAKDDDIDAIKLLMAYTFGKPKETIEHQGELIASIIRLPAKLTADEWAQQQSNNE